MDAIDWLQQQELETWKTKIRQLRQELREQRLSMGTVEPGRSEPGRKEESPSAAQSQTTPQEVAPPLSTGRSQKTVRPLSRDF